MSQIQRFTDHFGRVTINGRKYTSDQFGPNQRVTITLGPDARPSEPACTELRLVPHAEREGISA